MIKLNTAKTLALIQKTAESMGQNSPEENPSRIIAQADWTPSPDPLRSFFTTHYKGKNYLLTLANKTVSLSDTLPSDEGEIVVLFTLYEGHYQKADPHEWRKRGDLHYKKEPLLISAISHKIKLL